MSVKNDNNAPETNFTTQIARNHTEHGDTAAHVFAVITSALLEHSCVQTHSVNKGIKKFGERGVKSLEKELRQIQDRDSFMPIHFH